ncbi:MAG: hypothetical protein HQL86_06495, partial [Magnetococcales bacterium]|nr:hypothetical protein [Magnetococcales bacterium]
PFEMLRRVLPASMDFFKIESHGLEVLAFVTNLCVDCLMWIVVPVTLGLVYRWLREFGPEDTDEMEPEGIAPG